MWSARSRATSATPVWRRIEVSADIKLGKLHKILQTAMGWTDSHLHGFSSGGVLYDRQAERYLTDFDVEEGEIVALLGANGAGKTTTLKTVSGLRPVTTGTMTFEGRDIRGIPAHRRVEMGICQAPEGRGIFPGMNVVENLEMGAYARRGNQRGDTASDFERVFELFPRLKERRRQPGGTLSGGEQQMLAIGRALMSRPRLLLIDEASLGLSPALAKTVFQVVSRINDDGVTVVLVEQNVGVLPYADRALIMEKGTLVYEGVGDEIRGADLRETYLGASA